ncbi:ABC transporter [Penicillium pulvis]|uniref:ABC transporter n=1 Tax=Penicillium pulvis TaxID=1562058 RepID=UPI0025467737|nr:ABC transporter [Penicillium pulvis]KAJ5799046.1 ABC transporter [Penicillium pulvis]
MYLGYAISFWQGARFLGAGDIRLASVVTILLAIMTGTFSSLSVAAKIFAVIDRQSPIDPTSGSGSTLPAVRGEIRFENVKLIYPSRPGVTVMKDLSLTIPAGQSTAIVGASGSSKSTIISLLHRFYEPIDGKVLLDGHDITTLDPRWIRRQMPLVGQESMLFNTSIYNNIAYGFIGADLEHSPPDVKREAIEQAAKLANAHDFISNLPKSYSTEIGESGGLLSGGQKQRIAIARAIVSNPKILLLDEATSALDSKSEKVVQAALDSASGSRTTVIIAHRLSTVKKADKIIVLSNGAVVEEGTHTELLEKGGVYSTLISKQQINEKKSAIEEATDAATSETVSRQEKTEMQSFEHSVKLYPDGGADEEAGEISQPSENSKQHITTWTLIRTVARLNLPEQHWMVLGLFCSIICGAGFPVSAVFLAKLIVAMTQFNVTQDRARLTSDTSFWSIMYIVLAAGQLLSFSIEGVAFAYCGERLVRRVRMEQFRHMLRQDASYFDKMTTAELTATIAGNASNIAGLSGTTLGSLLNVVTTLLGSLILSIAIGWKLALVTASSIPILIVCGYLRFGILSKYQVHTKKCHIESATGVCEAIAMIRTTASFGLEHHVAQTYSAALGKQRRLNILPVIKASILYAVSQSLVFLCMALGFWYGGMLVIAKEYTVCSFTSASPQSNSEHSLGVPSIGCLLGTAPLGGVLIYGFRGCSISIKDSHEVMDPHDHSVDPRNSAYVMPGATLFPEALASILKTVQKVLGTVFFVPGNLVAPRITCTVPGSSRVLCDVPEFKQRRHSSLVLETSRLTARPNLTEYRPVY